jgi:hypothetical protein
MTPEGYKQIKAAVEKEHFVSTKAETGQDVPYVTIIESLQPNSGDILNRLAAAGLLAVLQAKYPSETSDKPALKLLPEMSGPRTLTFKDLNALNTDGNPYNFYPHP